MQRFAHRGDGNVGLRVIVVFMFLGGLLGTLAQLSQGWPGTFWEWLWLSVVVASLAGSLMLPLLWRRYEERILRWLERKYEETAPPGRR